MGTETAPTHEILNGVLSISVDIFCQFQNFATWLEAQILCILDGFQNGTLHSLWEITASATVPEILIFPYGWFNILILHSDCSQSCRLWRINLLHWNLPNMLRSVKRISLDLLSVKFLWDESWKQWKGAAPALIEAIDQESREIHKDLLLGRVDEHR